MTRAQKAAQVEEYVEKMVSSGAGPSDRRATMLAILERNRGGAR